MCSGCDAIGLNVDDLPHFRWQCEHVQHTIQQLSSVRIANLFSSSSFFSISLRHFRCVSNDVTQFSFFTLVPHFGWLMAVTAVIMRTHDLIYRFIEMKKKSEEEVEKNGKRKASKDINAIRFGYVFRSTSLTL